MYWMLLPPSADEGGHIEDVLRPPKSYWADLVHAGWDIVKNLLAPNHS